MKKFQILLALVCLAAVAALMVGCGGGGSSPAPGSVPTLQSIEITPGAPSLPLGLTQQFKATGRYSDNSSKDLTNSSTWSSSNPAAATISSSGMATAKGLGSTTITATYSGVTGTTTLTVTAAALASLAISPPPHLCRSAQLCNVRNRHLHRRQQTKCDGLRGNGRQRIPRSWASMRTAPPGSPSRWAWAPPPSPQLPAAFLPARA